MIDPIQEEGKRLCLAGSGESLPLIRLYQSIIPSYMYAPSLISCLWDHLIP